MTSSEPVLRDRVAAPATADAQWLLPVTFLVLLLAALAPVLSVKIPPLVDYPNHLSRMYVLVHLPHDPLLQRFYQLHWQMVPNLAMDLIVPPIARLTGVFMAGKIFVAAYMLLMLTGPFAVQYALFRQITVWPLVSFLVIFNGIFFYGFTNFLFGTGVAVWAVASWIGLREAHPALRFLVSLLFSLILFISHLHTLGLYGLTVLCYEIWRLRERQRPTGRRLVVELLVFAGPFLMTLALLAGTATVSGPSVTRWWLLPKLQGLFFVIKNFWTPLDLAVGTGIVAGIVWAYRRGYLEIHGVAWHVIVGSALVFLIMPFKLIGASYTDSRLPIAMVFILIGMARWSPSRSGVGVWFCLVVGGVALVRVAVVAATFDYFAAVGADFERSFQAIAPGSKVFVTRMADKGMRQTYGDLFTHIPTLAIAEWSSLETLAFTDPAKTVMVVRPEYRGIVPYEGLPPVIDDVVRNEIDPDATVPPDPNPGYYLHWRDSYDYLYVLFARPGTPPPMAGLTLAYQGQAFQLYRIEPSARSYSG